MSKEYFTMYEGQKIKLMPPMKEYQKPSSILKMKDNLKISNLPSSYILPAVASELQPKNQNPYGSCVAHATSFAMELTEYKRTGTYTKLSATFIHGNRGIYDVMNPIIKTEEDYALSVDESLNTAIRYGSVLYNTMPGTVSTRSAYNTIVSKSNKSSYKYEARNHRMAGAIQFKSDEIEEIKQRIYNGYPVIVSIDITGQDNTKREFYNLSTESSGGHRLCIVGWDANFVNQDNTKGAFIAFNSWYDGSDKTQSQWKVSWGVTIYEIYSFIDDAPATFNDSDEANFSKGCVKGSIYNNSKYSRGYYGDSKKRVDSLITAQETSTSGKTITYCPLAFGNSNFLENVPLPIPSYYDFGRSSDIATADKISQAVGYYTDGFILSRNDDYVATSCGAVLCKQGLCTTRNYGSLLTDNITLDNEAKYYHGHWGEDNGLQRSIILAGPSIISNDIVNSISGGKTPERIYGADRYATAAAISKNVNLSGFMDFIIIVNGTDYPDLVTAAALGSHSGSPIFCNDASNTLNSNIVNYINSHSTDLWGAIIVGSTSLISSAVENTLASMFTGGSKAIERVYGSDRYDTSVQIINRLWSNYNSIVLANGSSFNNMSSAAQLAAHLDAPVLLCDGNTLSANARTIINNTKASNGNCIYLASPSGTISSSLLSTL